MLLSLVIVGNYGRITLRKFVTTGILNSTITNETESITVDIGTPLSRLGRVNIAKN